MGVSRVSERTPEEIALIVVRMRLVGMPESEVPWMYIRLSRSRKGFDWEGWLDRGGHWTSAGKPVHGT